MSTQAMAAHFSSQKSSSTHRFQVDTTGFQFIICRGPVHFCRNWVWNTGLKTCDDELDLYTFQLKTCNEDDESYTFQLNTCAWIQTLSLCGFRNVCCCFEKFMSVASQKLNVINTLSSWRYNAQEKLSLPKRGQNFPCMIKPGPKPFHTLYHRGNSSPVSPG